MKAFARRPWLWLVVAMVLFVAVDIAFLVVAVLHPPVLIK